MKKRISVFSSQVPLQQSPFGEIEVPKIKEKEAEPLENAKPEAAQPIHKNCGRLILRKEKARRAGKTVWILSGFPEEISKEALQSLAKEAKIGCSCGGTLTNRTIELQGNQPDRVKKFFEAKGFRVAGG